MNIIGRIIWLIGAIIVGLLLFRFFFILFGANPFNDFVQFIYDTTRPLVSPFFGIFNYHYIPDRSAVEFATLMAIVVYTLIAAVLVQLLSPRRVR